MGRARKTASQPSPRSPVQAGTGDPNRHQRQTAALFGFVLFVLSLPICCSMCGRSLFAPISPSRSLQSDRSALVPPAAVIAEEPPLTATNRAERALRLLGDRDADVEAATTQARELLAPVSLAEMTNTAVVRAYALLRQREPEAERLRRRREAEEQRAEEALNRRHILCRDGTRSPTCTCGRTSFRGCCSHHGGVAGGCADP